VLETKHKKSVILSWFGTEHQMTEEQRLAYNVKQLGVTGAAEYERAETERRAKKKVCK